jgi:hypothetical protein
LNDRQATQQRDLSPIRNVGILFSMTGETFAVRFAKMLQVGSVVLATLGGVGALGPAAVRAQGLDPQLQEIRTLLREKRFPLALESLRLVARQIQDLRLETVAPAFPAAPAGWTTLPALSLLEEDEIWSNRIVAQRSYVTAPSPARMDLVIDVNTPFGPAVGLSFNPIVVMGDPRSRLVPIGSEKGLLRFNPDTGEGELRVLVGREILVTARGRGITAPELLIDLARGVDYSLLRRASGL